MYYTNDVGQSHSDGGISNLNFDVAFLQNKNFEVANFFLVLNSNNAYEALRKSFRQDRPTSRSRLGTNVSQLHTPRLSTPSPSLITLAMIRISPRTPCFESWTRLLRERASRHVPSTAPRPWAPPPTDLICLESRLH